MKTENPATDKTPTPAVQGPWATEIRSNADVTGNLNSKFKYDQSDDGPYQEMSKGASVNKYLEKIAMSKKFHIATKAFDGASPIAKIGLGLSAASFGLSAANYNNGKVTARANMDKADLERKSLTALKNINKTLSTATIAPSSFAAPKPKFNDPTNFK